MKGHQAGTYPMAFFIYRSWTALNTWYIARLHPRISALGLWLKPFTNLARHFFGTDHIRFNLREARLQAPLHFAGYGWDFVFHSLRASHLYYSSLYYRRMSRSVYIFCLWVSVAYVLCWMLALGDHSDMYPTPVSLCESDRHLNRLVPSYLFSLTTLWPSTVLIGTSALIGVTLGNAGLVALVSAVVLTFIWFFRHGSSSCILSLVSYIQGVEGGGVRGRCLILQLLLWSHQQALVLCWH